MLLELDYWGLEFSLDLEAGGERWRMGIDVMMGTGFASEWGRMIAL
jgi:hypothetical protein